MDKVEDTRKPSLPDQAKKILLGFFVMAIAGAVLYGLGWQQGRSQAQSSQQKLKSLEKELQVSQGQVNSLKNRNSLTQARAALLQTAVDLDQRNFGVANTNLQVAATALSQIQRSDNIDMAKLTELQKNIAQTNINVAVNLEEQRQKILIFVSDLNKLIPDDLK